MRKLKPKGRGDNHLFDYSKITENIYIGSDLCEGNVCPVHSDDFKKLGICVEINLSVERKEYPPEDIDSYTWIPVVDGYAPTPDQLDIGTAIINQVVKNNKKVYVHCKNGHGRSPTLVAAYLIKFKEMEVDEAINYIKKRRAEIHIEKTQYKALKKLAKNV
jgi:protein tyrosine phosphatase